MKQWSKISLFVVLLFVFFSTGCQAIRSRNIEVQAKQTELIADIRENPSQHKGKTVIMEGKILSIAYREWQTEVEFAELPLDLGFSPDLGMQSRKSYYVLFPERLDRSRYRRGKIVTVAASVIGAKEKEGNNYPLFVVEEAHILNRLHEVRFPHYGAMLSRP